jgi:hypothetical protein
MIATVQVLSLAAVRVVAEKHLPSLCGPNNQPTDYTEDVVHLYVCVEPSRLCAWRMEVPRGEWKFLRTKCRFLTAPIRHHVENGSF